jgi:hypothetical protein
MICESLPLEVYRKVIMTNKLNEVVIGMTQSRKTGSMKLITQLLSSVGRCAATVLFFVTTIAFVWQSTFFANTTAFADTTTMTASGSLVLAAADAGDQIRRDNKSFVRDAAEKVKEAANSNADKVEDATGDSGSFIERKAQRDAARVEKRANEDAARTQKAIDDNVNAVERTIDNIKDAFSK